MESKTYEERKTEKRYSILLKDGRLIGLWGNLRKLCEDMKIEDVNFLGYSALSKRRKEGSPMEFKTSEGIEYAIYIEKIRW